MRIKKLNLQNFMCYDAAHDLDFNSRFILLVGENGAGKTSLLEALADALGIWHATVLGYGWRNISEEHIRRGWVGSNGARSLEKQFPVEVAVEGEIGGQELKWARGIYKGKKTSNKNAGPAQSVIEGLAEKARAGEPAALPLIVFYGDGRLHLDRQVRASRGGKENPKRVQNRLSRFEGNRNSLDSRIAWKDLLQWVARQEWVTFQEKQEPVEYKVFKQAILDCLEGGESFGYDARSEQILVGIQRQGVLPLENLSAGQKSMVVMIGDLVRRLALLNPHLGLEVARESPGIVLIDELDLHLHPVWQRKIAANLKRTFQQLQFICTSHSPQIIGELQPDEVRLLQGKQVSQPAQSFGMDTNWVLEVLMGGSKCNEAVKVRLEQVFRFITDKKLSEAEAETIRLRGEIGNNNDLQRAMSLIERIKLLGK